MKNIKRILLVDDNDADNVFHRFIVAETDPTIMANTIEDSRKALYYFQQCFATGGSDEYPVPDILFLDINMPALNGFELLDQLKRLHDPYHCMEHIKIFMLTGSVNPDDEMRIRAGYASIVSDYFVKPLTIEMLINIENNFYEMHFLKRA